jgi:hypothetical protein
MSLTHGKKNACPRAEKCLLNRAMKDPEKFSEHHTRNTGDAFGASEASFYVVD